MSKNFIMFISVIWKKTIKFKIHYIYVCTGYNRNAGTKLNDAYKN